MKISQWFKEQSEKLNYSAFVMVLAQSRTFTEVIDRVKELEVAGKIIPEKEVVKRMEQLGCDPDTAVSVLAELDGFRLNEVKEYLKTLILKSDDTKVLERAFNLFRPAYPGWTDTLRERIRFLSSSFEDAIRLYSVSRDSSSLETEAYAQARQRAKTFHNWAQYLSLCQSRGDDPSDTLLRLFGLLDETDQDQVIWLYNELYARSPVDPKTFRLENLVLAWNASMSDIKKWMDNAMPGSRLEAKLVERYLEKKAFKEIRS